MSCEPPLTVEQSAQEEREEDARMKIFWAECLEQQALQLRRRALELVREKKVR